jgi:hypothetical protein
MARMMVLLPLPDWPRIKNALAGLDLDLGLGDQRLPVGARQTDLTQHQEVGVARSHFDMLAVRRFDRILEVMQGVMQVDDAIDRSAPVAKRGKLSINHDSAHWTLEKAWAVCIQPAELQVAAEIARQRHDQRHDGCEIGERAGEHGEAALTARLAMPGIAQVAHGPLQAGPLVGLAAHQSDALGVLASPDQNRAHVGLAPWRTLPASIRPRPSA